MKDGICKAHSIRQWRLLAMPPILWGVDIKQLLHVCGRRLDLRAVVNEQGQQEIEVFCATDDEHAQAEALVLQAAADEVLRSDINAKCSKQIVTLVDSVLKRAAGG
jgi:hypothetical protein